jgi:hypothetical protein
MVIISSSIIITISFSAPPLQLHQASNTTFFVGTIL